MIPQLRKDRGMNPYLFLEKNSIHNLTSFEKRRANSNSIRITEIISPPFNCSGAPHPGVSHICILMISKLTFLFSG